MLWNLSEICYIFYLPPAGDYNLQYVSVYVHVWVRACVCLAVSSKTATVTYFLVNY